MPGSVRRSSRSASASTRSGATAAMHSARPEQRLRPTACTHGEQAASTRITVSTSHGDGRSRSSGSVAPQMLSTRRPVSRAQ